MKVAKKVRLLTKDKDGNFKKSENVEILRHRSVINQSTVTESEQSYKETGVLWIVDEKATKEWHDAKKPKKKAVKKPNENKE